MIFRLVVDDGEGEDAREVGLIECDTAPPVETIVYIGKGPAKDAEKFSVGYHYWYIPVPVRGYPSEPQCYIYMTPITEESVNMPT